MSMAATAMPGSIEPSSNAILTRPMLALSGMMMTAMGSFYLLLSAIPAHAATLGGASAAGLSTGALMGATIIGELAAPRLIISMGRARALAGALLMMALPCLATFSTSLALVLATCAARGLGLGVLLVAACGLAARLAPPARRAEALGAFGVASAIPSIVAVPLGPSALASLGAGQTGTIAAMLALAALLTIAWLPADAQTPTDAAYSHSLPAVRILGWPLMTLALGAIVIGAAVTFLPLAHPELSRTMIMAALLLQGLASACARWAAGRPIDRHGPFVALIGAAALSIAGLVCLAAPGAPAVLAGMTISGVAFGLAQSASLSRLLADASPAQADTVGALWNGTYDAGLGLGGVALGGLAALLGYPASFVVASLSLTIVAGAVFLACAHRRSAC